MKSLILLTASRLLFPLMILFSVFLLLRGHNAPGGGFVGGLVASAAIALHALAHGIAATHRVVAVPPVALVAMGLSCALASGLVAWAWGQPYLTGLWIAVPLAGKIGTPLLFDLGVYLLVVGMVTHLLFLLWEE
ncbi:MAG: Na(+)/H(+) antiporter subunit B [Candidatus Binatia bacterium]|nr:MAG: Na(+)/H(+) antiporter subunit B [Candidatus Binatia bacterium]